MPWVTANGDAQLDVRTPEVRFKDRSCILDELDGSQLRSVIILTYSFKKERFCSV